MANSSVRSFTSTVDPSASRSTAWAPGAVRMSSLSRDGDMRFHTVNGDVTVETPSSLDARVSLSTLHGSISSDYPVQLSGRFGPRRASGTIGKGGREIDMETVNGSIELRKAR